MPVLPLRPGKCDSGEVRETQGGVIASPHRSTTSQHELLQSKSLQDREEKIRVSASKSAVATGDNELCISGLKRVEPSHLRMTVSEPLWGQRKR